MPYPITDTPSQVSQSITGASLISNVGTETVYLGPDSSVSALNYELQLSAGATVNWKGSDLWAVTASTLVSSLGVQYGADTSVTPGPSTVVSNANSVLLQQIDVNTGVYFSTNFLNITKYSTITIVFRGVPGGFTPPGNTANYFSVSVYFQEPDILGGQFEERFIVPAGVNGFTSAQVVLPVRGPVLGIDIAGVGPRAVRIFARVYGSTNALAPQYFTYGQGLAPADQGSNYRTALSGTWGASFGPLASNAGATYFPPSWSGNATLVLANGVTAVGGQINVEMYTAYGTTRYLAAFSLSVSTFNTLTVPLLLPAAPIQINVLNQSAAANMSGVIGLTYLRS